MDCARLSDAELLRLVREGGETASAALDELEQRHFPAARGTEEAEQDVSQGNFAPGATVPPVSEALKSDPPVSDPLVSQALATALWTTGSPGAEAAATHKRRLAVLGAAGAGARTKGRRRADLFVRGAAVAGLCGIGGAVALSFAGADSPKGKPQSKASAPPVRPPSSPPSKAPAPSSTQTSATPAAKATEKTGPPSKPSRGRPFAPHVSTPADGTAVEWLFDEVAGAVTPDTSGNDKDGTLVGASAASTAAGGALRFDGGQFVASDGPLVDTSSSFSVSARVKLNNTDSSQTVVSQDGAESSAFLLQYDAEESQWEMRIPEGPSDDVDADADEAVSDVEVEAGEWTDLTGVYDEAAGKVRLYVNGSPGESVDHEEDFASEGDFVVGRGLGENEYFRAVDGTVDDVRALGRAVSPAEAKSLAGRSS